jgi:hypothetical protein
MHRSLSRRPVSRRSLARGAALAVALVVAVLPGVAWAGDGSGLPTPPTDPLGSVAGSVGSVLGGSTPGGQASGPGAAAPNADPAPNAGTQQTSPSLPAPPSPLDPSQLQQLLAALGISEDCSAAVQKDLQNLIADLPASVQAIIDAIVSQLPSGPLPNPVQLTDPQSGATVIMKSLGNGQPPTFTAPKPPDLPIAKDLQQLVDDLQNKCKPSLPSNPPSGGSQLPPPQQQQPISAPQPQAPAPAAQPVSYPGYAPTGAPPVDPSDDVPLAVLAAIALLSAAGALSYRMVFRAGPRS